MEEIQSPIRPVKTENMPAPTRFLRRCRRIDHTNTPETWQKYGGKHETQSTNSTQTPPWQKYAEALLYGGETLSQRTHRDLFCDTYGDSFSNSYSDTYSDTYSDHALLSRHRQDGVVAARSPGGGVNEEMDGLVRYRGWWDLGEHNVQVNGAEDLLQGVEGEPTQFTLDEVGPVLHDRLELDVPVPALPPRHQVEHVRALSCLPVLSTGGAGERYTEGGEEREVGGLVPHAQEAREEVDLACDCRDSQKAGGAYYEEREYCFVGEVGVNVGSFLEDDDVAPCSFGC